MSVAELPNRSPEFERVPPHDVVAEQGVLGGMMLSKDAIADVVELLRGNDLYRPAHELIYEAILDLYGRGEPVDAVTVSAELTKLGEIGRVVAHLICTHLLHQCQQRQMLVITRVLCASAQSCDV